MGNQVLRVLYIQTGDYAEAWHRFRAGGGETFRDQRASVDFVERLAGAFNVTVLARCGREHDELLKPNLRSVGVTDAYFYSRRKLKSLLEGLRPSLVILSTPDWYIVSWLARRRISCLPVFADIFSNEGLRQKFRLARLAFWLRRLQAPCVANHSYAASVSLRKLGLRDSQIVPWDRIPISATPGVKNPPKHPPFRLLFVGTLSLEKGLKDCLDALRSLNVRSEDYVLSIIGSGNLKFFLEYAGKQGLKKFVNFKGRQSNDEVRAAMREHDLVLVPSRLEYAEGLPNTLIEGLASRTPVIASNHPAFFERLVGGEHVIFFKAADFSDLAAKVKSTVLNEELYVSLSSNAHNSLARLAFGIPILELQRLFLNDPSGDTWMREHTLEKLLK